MKVARVPNIPSLLKDLQKQGRVGIRHGGQRHHRPV